MFLHFATPENVTNMKHTWPIFEIFLVPAFFVSEVILKMDKKNYPQVKKHIYFEQIFQYCFVGNIVNNQLGKIHTKQFSSTKSILSLFPHIVLTSIIEYFVVLGTLKFACVIASKFATLYLCFLIIIGDFRNKGQKSFF